MSLIEKINELLAKSFPRGRVGDLHNVQRGVVHQDFTRDHRLGYIGSLDHLGVTLYGEFTAQDGSALVVGKKYLNHAEVYALLYRHETGKQVRIGDSDAILYR